MAKTTVSFIQAIHLVEKKWPAIGYHAMIDIKGTVHPGRSEMLAGAHAYGLNQHSLGVCVFGNFDRESPRPEQWQSLIRVLEKWCRKYRIAADTNTILGHCDVPGTTKSCPGANLYRYLPWLRQEVTKRLSTQSR